MESIETLRNLLGAFFPEDISTHFELKEVNKKSGYIQIVFEELPELLPPQMDKPTEIVLDGFCNPLELQSFPLKGKPVYLKLYRRRWKYKGEKEHYSNSYNLHDDGVKATKEFATFLKGAFGQTPDQYNHNS